MSLNVFWVRLGHMGAAYIGLADPLPSIVEGQSNYDLYTTGLLNDSTVGVFRKCEYLRLRRACIRTARISAEAFQKALCPHKLVELDAARVNADLTISDILNGLATNKQSQVKQYIG